jgi:hypothetical protein
MKPPKVAVDVLGCHAGTAREVGLGPLMATVDDPDVQVTSVPFAGQPAENLVADSQGDAEWITGAAVGDEQGVPVGDELDAPFDGVLELASTLGVFGLSDLSIRLSITEVVGVQDTSVALCSRVLKTRKWAVLR